MFDRCSFEPTCRNYNPNHYDTRCRLVQGCMGGNFRYENKNAFERHEEMVRAAFAETQSSSPVRTAMSVAENTGK